jgi:hypothetical protein
LISSVRRSGPRRCAGSAAPFQIAAQLLRIALGPADEPEEVRACRGEDVLAPYGVRIRVRDLGQVREEPGHEQRPDPGIERFPPPAPGGSHGDAVEQPQVVRRTRHGPREHACERGAAVVGHARREQDVGARPEQVRLPEPARAPTHASSSSACV